MYNFDVLEKRCKKYYRKKYFLIFTPLLAFFVFGISYIFLFNKPKTVVHIKKTEIVKHIKKQKVEKKSPTLPLNNNLKNGKCYCLQFFAAKEAGIKYLHLKEKKLKKLGFDCYIHKGTSLLHLNCNETEDINNLLKSKELARKNKLDFLTKIVLCEYKQKIAKRVEKIKKIPEQKSTFILKSQKFNVANLKKLFQDRQSYNLALKIARFYYNSKDYKDAVIWAKKANSIDKTDVESWIIYAKSLYNLGNKVKAKKILNIYLQFENSNQINQILAKWNNQ